MADAFENILGQPQVREFLRATVAHDKVSHAYLFTGPAGSNKTMAAYAFAQAVLCPKGASGPRGGNCGVCDACRRIMRKKHPDVRYFAPEGAGGYLVEQIRDIVKKHDLYLFADEVYREYIYTDEPYTSAMHLEGIENNVILVDSVPKRYSECGIRIGAIITKNTEVRKAVLKFCQARLSPPLMGQIIAEASLEAPESYIEGVQKEYVERRNCLVNGLNQIPGVFSPMPKGAFYTVAKLPVDNAEKFCRWLLEEFSY